MTDLPLHPALVHLPLGVAMVAPLLALALLYGWISGQLPRKAWWLAVGLQVLIVGGAFGALRTGEEEEERVEDFVPEDAIHEHEEAGELFLGASAVVFGLMVAAGLLKGERAARGLAAVAVLGGVAAAAAGMRAGHLGGQLVFTHGAGGVPAENAPVVPEEAGE